MVSMHVIGVHARKKNNGSHETESREINSADTEACSDLPQRQRQLQIKSWNLCQV